MTPAIPVPTSRVQNTPKTPVISEPFIDRVSYLVPTIAAIAAACLYVPHFVTGFCVGPKLVAVSIVIGIASKILGLDKEDENDEYSKEVKKYPFTFSFILPILEEGAFRGALLPLITQVALRVFPWTVGAFGATGLSIASAAAIGITSLGFGLVHLTNPHANAGLQAITTTIGGISLGTLYQSFGLGAAIGAHVCNNTIGVALIKIFDIGSEEPKKEPVKAPRR